ncbi:hypothetical protein [Flavicella sediminum]|uniref:hypothetical protein n=1 Tax=Flavicella sediminum TaxID=2585141 RepID=UPI0011202474|nr:hypothetical protein [Flavicella sediminum]
MGVLNFWEGDNPMNPMVLFKKGYKIMVGNTDNGEVEALDSSQLLEAFTTDDLADGVDTKRYTAAEKAKMGNVPSDTAGGISAAKAEAIAASVPRANHTGTQLAATISDFTAAAKAAETVTSLTVNNHVISFTNESGTLVTFDTKIYTDEQISALKGSAPEAFDTLQEIAAWIANEDSEDDSTLTSLLTAIGLRETIESADARELILTEAIEAVDEKAVENLEFINENKTEVDRRHQTLLTGSTAYTIADTVSQLEGGTTIDLIALEKILGENNSAGILIAPFLQADSFVPAALPIDGSANAFFTGGGGAFIDKFGNQKQEVVDKLRINYREVNGERVPFYKFESDSFIQRVKNSEPTVAEGSESNIIYESRAIPFLNADAVTNGIVLDGDGHTNYRYCGIAVSETDHVFSAFAMLDDFSEPVIGSSGAITNDFSIVIGGTRVPSANCLTQYVGGGLYRIYGKGTTGTANLSANGIVKDDSQSNKKVFMTGLNLVAGTSLKSYAKTTGAIVTRLGDKCKFPTVTGFLDKGEFNFIIKFLFESGVTTRHAAYESAGNYITINYNDTEFEAYLYKGNVLMRHVKCLQTFADGGIYNVAINFSEIENRVFIGGIKKALTADVAEAGSIALDADFMPYHYSSEADPRGNGEIALMAVDSIYKTDEEFITITSR